MDLLEGYDSSSSSSSSTDGVQQKQQQPKCEPFSNKATLDQHRRQRNASTASAVATSPTPRPSDSTTAGGTTRIISKSRSQQQEKQQQHIGKKILSLASVLPPHILAALTRSTVSGSSAGRPTPKMNNASSGLNDDDDYDDNYDSSDDDNEKYSDTNSVMASAAVRDNSEIKEGRSSAQRLKQTPNTTPRSSNEFSSFLLDLQRTMPTESQGSTSQKSKESTQSLRSRHVEVASTTPDKSSSTATNTSSSGMGDAFLATTVTTTTRAAASTTVRDIHHDSDNVVRVDDSEGCSGSSRQLLMRPTSLVSSVSEVPAARSMSRVCAAPPVTIGWVGQSTTHPTLKTPSAVASSLPPNLTLSISSAAEAADTVQRSRSRKEMERALRRGQIETVLDDAGLTTTIQGADPNDLSRMQQQPSTADLDSSVVSTVRNVPTQVYDPSAGGLAVASFSVRKGSGKNQINQLLAQAAHLERERAQQPLSSQVTKIQRSNAKRKYGW